MSVYHFLGFIMHQPEGNLLYMLNNSDFCHKAKQILLAYQRPLDYAERYDDLAKFCVCFSGVLLEQLQDPVLIDQCRDFIDIPRMLERYALATNIELAGTGYYHPLFPLIPQHDWEEHIVRGRNKITEVFGRAR
jgi:alpha-amylase/alpha-mannosidase (GH57 family)